MLRRLFYPAGLLALVLVVGPVGFAKSQDNDAPPPPANAPVPLQDAPLAAPPQELPENNTAQSVPTTNSDCPNCQTDEGIGGGGRGGRHGGFLQAGTPSKGCREWGYGSPDLFYNFYAAPSCNGVGAYLYVSPLPVPPHVGHTYITYQPLMPHEFLYPHQRSYHRYYDEGRGLTRTHVMYYSPPIRTAHQHVHNAFKIAR